MKVRIALIRQYDRHPDDHHYGEPFDTEIDDLLDDDSMWSPARSEVGYPQATTYKGRISIALHETGPIIDFVVQNADQIPAYISAISAAVSAWVATRRSRNRQLPDEGDINRKTGTQISVDGFSFNCERTVKRKELKKIVKSLARLAKKHKDG